MISTLHSEYARIAKAHGTFYLNEKIEIEIKKTKSSKCIGPPPLESLILQFPEETTIEILQKIDKILIKRTELNLKKLKATPTKKTTKNHKTKTL